MTPSRSPGSHPAGVVVRSAGGAHRERHGAVLHLALGLAVDQTQLAARRIEHVLLQQVVSGTRAGHGDDLVGHDRVHHRVVVVEVVLTEVERVARPVAVPGLAVVDDDAVHPGDEVGRLLLGAAGLGHDLGDDLLARRRDDHVVDRADVGVRVDRGCGRGCGGAHGPLLLGTRLLQVSMCILLLRPALSTD